MPIWCGDQRPGRPLPAGSCKCHRKAAGRGRHRPRRFGLLASQRQLEAAVSARTALQDALAARQQGFDLTLWESASTSLHAPYRLTGEEVSAAVVDEVFSKFCVGK
ncbi:MAG: hypothetical protein ACLU9S_04165 [Oscillospiraceae bacterium]